MRASGKGGRPTGVSVDKDGNLIPANSGQGGARGKGELSKSASKSGKEPPPTPGSVEKPKDPNP